MARRDAIWHVVIDGEQHGPLSRTQILEFLDKGRLVGGDLIWRPGFNDWKSVHEVADFWHPPEPTSLGPPPLPTTTGETERDDQTVAVATTKKWSLWKAANIGLLLSVIVLALQVASGRGFELAHYAPTASAATVAELAGRIVAAPLLFVLVAAIRNIVGWQLPKSDARAINGAIVFVFSFVGIGIALIIYGFWFFSSQEFISGATRDYFMATMQPSCVRRQASLRQGASPTDAQISSYCTCVGARMADNTTYRRLTSDPSAADVREHLKQQAEAAGQACRNTLGL